MHATLERAYLLGQLPAPARIELHIDERPSRPRCQTPATLRGMLPEKVPAGTRGAGYRGDGVLRTSLTKTDWLADPRTNALAWWVPHAAIFAALLTPVPVRVGIWAVMFAWMGAACILNSRRCGRTHCRYTGPYYLAMIVPVLALGIAPVLITLTGWFAIAVAILLGSKLIWWATERAWGKFSLS